MLAGLGLLVLFAIQAVRTMTIRHDANVAKRINARLGMSEQGNTFLAGAILIAIFVGIVLAILNALGYDTSTIGKDCVEVVYQSGVVDKICQ